MRGRHLAICVGFEDLRAIQGAVANMSSGKSDSAGSQSAEPSRVQYQTPLSNSRLLPGSCILVAVYVHL